MRQVDGTSLAAELSMVRIGVRLSTIDRPQCIPSDGVTWFPGNDISVLAFI